MSPALHEFFDSLLHTVRKIVEPIASDTATQSAHKIKHILLEMEDTKKREALQASAAEQVSS